MTRVPLFTSLARTPSKALSGRCCGFKELLLLLALTLWSFALIVIPKRIAAAHGAGNEWNQVGKPRVIVQPEVELAADCAARRGGPVLSIEALTSDEWTELSAEDFESRYVRASRPVVVRDALAGTDAMGMWDSDDHLSVNFGKWVVDVKEEGVPGTEKKSFEWFLQNYKGSTGRLHLNQRMTKRMASQVILPDVFCGVVEHGLRQDVQLSMTSGSHKGPIHCDSEDELLMQFDGSKTVYLADPGYFKALDVKRGSYRHRAYHDVAVADIDFWKPDERKHPRFAEVRWLQVEVQAGDLLYIPAYWFHAIQSEGERNLVVNHWFAQLPEDRAPYDEPDTEPEDECCDECWPCKIRTFCRHTLGINPKFPACAATLELDGVLTPGFKMDETAGIMQADDKGTKGTDIKGEETQADEVLYRDGEDVVRSDKEPDFALHTPLVIESDDAYGYPGDEEMGDNEIDDSTSDDTPPEDAMKERDYDGSGEGDGVR